VVQRILDAVDVAVDVAPRWKTTPPEARDDGPEAG